MVHFASGKGHAKMIAAASVLTELFLSCSALAALFMLQWILTRRDNWDPINRRFLFGIRVTILLFAGRILITFTGIQAFRILVLLGAAFIPLAVILLTEGLLRRHAPQSIKSFIAAGTILFGLSAFWYSDSIDPPRLLALLVFQILGFCLAGWLILNRDRASLSLSENTMVTRLGLSLILFIPLAVGDFLLIYLGLPIQFSALGVLILCWLAIGLARAHLGHGAVLISMGLIIAGAISVGLLIGVLVEADRDGLLMIIAILIAMMFLMAIFHDARSLRSEERSIGLLRHMATAETDDAVVFLRDLRAHPLVEGAVVINDGNLAGLQGGTLDAIFAAAPVLRRSNPPALGPMADDHITHLFDRYSATHIMLARAQPRVLIALSMPSLSLSPNAELELQVVQRMAALISMQYNDKKRGEGAVDDG